MLPTTYDMRWTSKLICRDLKGLAARCTNRARSLLLSTSGAPDHAVRKATDTPPRTLTPQSEVDNEPPIDIEDFDDAKSQCTVPSFSPGTVADSNSTLPTEISQNSLEGPATLCSLLNQKLKDLYTSRERDLPHTERWTFRGAWLMLHVATQYCASNPAHDNFNPGPSHSNETALLLEILRGCISYLNCQLLTLG